MAAGTSARASRAEDRRLPRPVRPSRAGGAHVPHVDRRDGGGAPERVSPRPLQDAVAQAPMGYRGRVVREGGAQVSSRTLVGALVVALALTLVAGASAAAEATRLRVQEYRVPAGTHPHDVAVAPDGTVGYTAQHTGKLGRLDPKTGQTTEIPLGAGSAPHGVIVGPDGAAWVTDGGLNAIVRVDPNTSGVRVFRLPASTGYANLNTATFDRRGILWFTGQSGIYGSLDPKSGRMRVFDAPRGEGPYGITTTPSGDVYYASLAGGYLGRINPRTGRAAVLRPPTAGAGVRRAWSDSRGRIWISEWNAGKVGMYDPRSRRWREWRVPGSNPMIYAVYVDDRDKV